MRDILRTGRGRGAWVAFPMLMVSVLRLASTPGSASADMYYDILANPIPPFSSYSTIFPNWTMVPQSSFLIVECDDTTCNWCINSAMTGLTIFNYGTASGGPVTGDIKNLYWQTICGSSNSGLTAMTYAGVWTVGVDNFPAWTWAGSKAYTQDPCTACLCMPAMYLYTDISACPTDGATVELGPAINDMFEGGMTNNCWDALPWGVTTDSTAKTIRYVLKEGDLDRAAPGDTITYTVYYGRPGTTNITGITVTDSIPAYTHLVFGSAVPAADPGWDPDPGPPMKLRWSLPGGMPGTGPTSQVIFKLSVDWGNGESFEPGSGDEAPMEGSRLNNTAQVSWSGASCNNSMVSQPTDTVVSRFLFWKIGSNDILFASGYGVSDDEMTYEIFMKNISTKKTWWNVNIWDTVPAEIDVWADGFGLDDPCTGWTMTPSGCASANAGKIVTGSAKTILTWKLDMAPQFTLTVRFRAKVRPTIPAGSTCINRVSLLAQGRTGIVDGTGNSRRPANFTHLAMIVLRTMYFSYTSYAGNADDKACPGFFISFFPLNMSTNFEFRKLEYNGVGVALTGGKSASINVLVGSCLGGFASDLGLSNAGCKIERTPAVYWPGIWDNWDGTERCMTYPFDFLYKVTSNSPILWLTMSEGSDANDDSFTYLPSTSLNYCGFMHYGSLRPDESALATIGHGDRLAVINTSINSLGVFDPAQDTVVHVFRWNPLNLNWDYQKTGNIAGESIWMPLEGTYGTTTNDLYHCRVISSDTQMMIYQGYHTFGAPGIGGAFDNHGGMVPNSTNGNLVSIVGSGTFYPIVHPTLNPNCVVGNTSLASPATYRIYKYQPISTKVPSNAWPTTLAGSAGIWLPKAVDRVNAGLAPGAPALEGNAHVYGGGYDTAMNSSTYATAWKIELFDGGPIQVNTGGQIFSQWAGASNLHAANGDTAGDDFWFHHATGGKNQDTLYINVFCPKTGMAVQVNSAAQAGGGVSARYTTDGVDQVIVISALSVPAGGTRTNYRITLAAGGAQGEVVVQYLQGKITEKFFTAPFVRTGVHYVFYAPATVFTGQSFWITVVVIDSGGGTKTDYCGTTSFTSTDPTARIESAAMDGYNYVWDSSGPPSCGASPWDNGVKLFMNLSLTRLGNQTLVATDSLDGSIIGLGTINVVGADVKLFKEPRLSVMASGDTVRFKVCWSNYSSASAFTFVVTDAIPMGTTFIPEASAAALDCRSTDGVAMNVSYSTASSAAVPPAASFTTGNPVAGTRWLRWTIPMAGVQTTGCSCYRLQVN